MASQLPKCRAARARRQPVATGAGLGLAA